MVSLRVRLDELDRTGALIDLSPEQATGLQDTSLVEVSPAGVGRFRLVPNGNVGAVRFGDVQVEVTPKDRVPVGHLMFLLGYARDSGFRSEFVVAEAHDDLWAAMAESLAAAGEAALRLGVLQGYRSRQEALLSVRGRIAFAEQLRRRPGQIVPLEVSYDDFTTDIVENRILLAACQRMLAVVGIRAEVRRRLLHLTARLGEVARLLPGGSIPPWQPSRLNERYHGALGLAEVILRNSSTRTSAKGVTMSAFVVEMPKVFEDFVTTALAQAMRRHPGRLEAQHKAFLTGPGDWRQGSHHGDIVMYADAVLLDPRGTPMTVFDAKYKLADSTGSHANADHYQMLAYCTALDVHTAWLIYAAGGEPNRRSIKHVDIEVITAPLDLTRTPTSLLGRVREIADAAWDRARVGRTPVRGSVGDEVASSAQRESVDHFCSTDSRESSVATTQAP